MEIYRNSVLNQLGEPIPDVTVLVTDINDNPVTTTPTPVPPTDAHGEFSFSAPNGKYKVTLQHPNLDGGVARTVQVLLYDPADDNIITKLSAAGVTNGTGVLLVGKLPAHPHVKADITDFAHAHLTDDITDFIGAVGAMIDAAPVNAHSHATADVTGFAAAVTTIVDAAPVKAHEHVKADVTDFAHLHVAADVTDLSDFVDAAVAAASGAHTHVVANVTDFDAAVQAAITAAGVSAHEHTVMEISDIDPYTTAMIADATFQRNNILSGWTSVDGHLTGDPLTWYALADGTEFTLTPDGLTNFDGYTSIIVAGNAQTETITIVGSEETITVASGDAADITGIGEILSIHHVGYQGGISDISLLRPAHKHFSADVIGDPAAHGHHMADIDDFYEPGIELLAGWENVVAPVNVAVLDGDPAMWHSGVGLPFDLQPVEINFTEATCIFVRSPSADMITVFGPGGSADGGSNEAIDITGLGGVTSIRFTPLNAQSGITSITLAAPVHTHLVDHEHLAEDISDLPSVVGGIVDTAISEIALPEPVSVWADLTTGLMYGLTVDLGQVRAALSTDAQYWNNMEDPANWTVGGDATWNGVSYDFMYGSTLTLTPGAWTNGGYWAISLITGNPDMQFHFYDGSVWSDVLYANGGPVVVPSDTTQIQINCASPASLDGILVEVPA